MTKKKMANFGLLMLILSTVACSTPKQPTIEPTQLPSSQPTIEPTVEVTPEQYWSAIASSSGNLGIGEANLYSATNIRLRNLSLNYAFPKAMLKNTPFQQVKLGVSCNNVWMIKSNMKGVDPESVFATSTNATGFENAASPTSRTFLFNVTLGF